jgi:hypothetical protein
MKSKGTAEKPDPGDKTRAVDMVSFTVAKEPKNIDEFLEDLGTAMTSPSM